MVLRLVALSLILGSASMALAQEGEPTPDEPAEAPAPLPAPTLQGEEPLAPAEPTAAPEEEAPQILMHIGSGDHPEWADEPSGELPRDIGFEVPGDARQVTGGAVPGVNAREPLPPFVVTIGAGFARLLAVTPIDFFRLEERFEATVPDFPTLRLGAAATQMFGDNDNYVVGGGARIGMGTTVCDDGGGLQCEGVIFVQPGFLSGQLGTRFDLNASLSLRVILERLFELAIDGGYSLQIDGDASLFHVTGQAGFVF